MQTLVNKTAAALMEADNGALGAELATQRLTVSILATKASSCVMVSNQFMQGHPRMVCSVFARPPWKAGKLMPFHQGSKNVLLLCSC